MEYISHCLNPYYEQYLYLGLILGEILSPFILLADLHRLLLFF
jgi:hypothetical protein